MLESGLHALVLADSAFSALCADRLFPVILPNDASLPSVSYQTISTTRKRLLSGDADTTSSRLQFDVWSETYAVAKQVTAALMRVLEGLTATLPDGTRVLSSELVSCHDLYESDARTFRVSIDLKFLTS